MSRLALIAVFAWFVLAPGSPARAAELVMFESQACEWCEIWNEEVGVIYDKTTEARVAPLRRVDVFEDRPADLKGVKRVLYTPTFVLMEQGREFGRIVGYPGEDFFWQMLENLLKKLPPAVRQACTTPQRKPSNGEALC